MKAISFLCMIAVATIGSAQSASMYYDIKTKQLFPVVKRSIGTFQNVLHTKVNLEYSAFVGVDSLQLRPIAGVALTYTAPLATNLTFEIGPALLYRDSTLKFSGVFLGAVAKF